MTWWAWHQDQRGRCHDVRVRGEATAERQTSAGCLERTQGLGKPSGNVYEDTSIWGERALIYLMEASLSFSIRLVPFTPTPGR